MKRGLLILVSVLITTAGDAQKALYSSMSEALLKQSHKVWYIRTLTDSMTVKNGVVVYADGRIKDRNGIIYPMADGDCIKCKDELIVFYQWIIDINGIKTKKHMMRVWSVIDKPVTLQNGTYAMPDGTIRLLSGAYIKLKNKDFMGFNGSGVIALE
jgi:hypothetical protein